jgi:hypothetical protein
MTKKVIITKEEDRILKKEISPKLMTIVKRSYSMHPYWECKFCNRWIEKNIYTHLFKYHKKEVYSVIPKKYHSILRKIEDGIK